MNIYMNIHFHIYIYESFEPEVQKYTLVNTETINIHAVKII